MAFLEVDRVDKVFPLPGGKQYIALKSVDLTLKKGEFVSLIGHSGCGKSTLLNIVAGLDRATVGGVVLDGREINSPGPDRMMVFQNYSLLPWKTVRQNIALAVNKVMADLPAGERKAIVEQHIDLVGLRAAADKKPKELSGGMKQRVAIARALAGKPPLIMADEPTAALDSHSGHAVIELLCKLAKDNGHTVLMVTHDPRIIDVADRVTYLEDGMLKGDTRL